MATGVILAAIPCVDGVDIEKIKDGSIVEIKAGEREAEVKIE